MQWGVKSTNTTSQGSQEIVSEVTLPTSFNSNNYVTLATAMGTDATAGGQDILNVTYKSTSGFKCRITDRTDRGTIFENYSWISIGT